MTSCSIWRQTTAVANRIGLRPSSHRDCCQLLSTECDRLNLLLTIIVCCVDNIFVMTPKSNKRRASFFSQWRYSCLIHLMPLSIQLMLPVKHEYRSNEVYKPSGMNFER